MRGSSVGFGEGPAPSIAPAVRKAAKRAGCTLRSDPSAVGIHLLISDIPPLHVDNPDYSKVPRPPTNGHHRPLWANWGFYQQPVPYAYEVHNLEHGGIIIHLGLGISTRRRHEGRAPVGRLAALHADRPRPARRRAAARRDDHELAARDDLQEVEPARARRHPHLPRHLPRHRPRAGAVAQHRAPAPNDLPTPALPDPTA